MLPDGVSERVSFDVGMDRRLVHRRAIGEVFVTSVVPRRHRRWRCGVQLSRSHIRMPAPGGDLPISLMLEASRQAGIAIAHVGFEVDLDKLFLLDRVEMSWVGGAPAVPCAEPFEAELDVIVSGVRLRAGRVYELRFKGSWLVEGVVVAVAAASMRCISPDVYRALRRHAPPIESAIEHGPEMIRRDDTGRLVVGWDPFDPMLFDHELDHVPGMALVDSMLAVSPESTSIGIVFHQLAELNAPIHLEIDRSSTEVRYAFVQGERPVASGHTSEDATRWEDLACES